MDNIISLLSQQNHLLLENMQFACRFTERATKGYQSIQSFSDYMDWLSFMQQTLTKNIVQNIQVSQQIYH